MFLTPRKTNKAFISEVKTKGGKPFVIKVPNVRIHDVFHLKTQQGILLSINVPLGTIANDLIRTLDEQALQETIDRRSQWFPQSKLSKEKIIEYFRPSMDPSNNHVDVLVSESKEPSSIIWWGESVECFDVLLRKGKRVLREANATFTLEAHGLYFYEQKFGIRWIVREASFHDPPTMDDEVCNDKEDIENFWRDEMEGVYLSIQDDILRLEDKIRLLRQEKEELGLILRQAIEIPEICPAWHASLEQLRDRISKYQSGMLWT